MKRRRTDKCNIHRFFCINCGREGIPLARTLSTNRSAFHRKKLYCPYCKCYVNHAECRNEIEVWEFKEAFEKGEFLKEAEESVKQANHSIFMRNTSQW